VLDKESMMLSCLGQRVLMPTHMCHFSQKVVFLQTNIGVIKTRNPELG